MADGKVVTAGDLKKFLLDVPDDVPVYEYNGLVGHGLEVQTAQVFQAPGRSIILRWMTAHKEKPHWALLFKARRLPKK